MKKLLSFKISESDQSRGPFAQSASLLVQNYGLTLDPALLAIDSFYALTELFQLSASSICQLLNLIESIIDQNTGYNLYKSEDYNLANLSYHQDILHRLEIRLRENIFDLEHHLDPKWPRLYDTNSEGVAEKKERTVRTANLLLTDFNKLFSRTQYLLAQCQSGMSVCMNSAAIAESQRAIYQAKQVQQLTRLAFFYIPLSFTTSFFGMNMGLFGSGGLHLWVWFLVSIPLVILSYVALALLGGKTRLNLKPLRKIM